MVSGVKRTKMLVRRLSFMKFQLRWARDVFLSMSNICRYVMMSCVWGGGGGDSALVTSPTIMWFKYCKVYLVRVLDMDTKPQLLSTEVTASLTYMYKYRQNT